jgi:tripartite-type tricarboxylate transporter receptor subunit TctC
VELFKLRTGTRIVHVPYKGTAPAVTDLIGGQVAMTMTGVPPVLEFIRNGRVRALGVSSLRRIDALPEVPTIAEAGCRGLRSHAVVRHRGARRHARSHRRAAERGAALDPGER